jgi:glycine betaine/proline transport system permease protein
MTTITTPSTTSTQTPNRWLWWAGLVGLLLLVYLITLALPTFTQQFPESWYLGVRPRVDAFQEWVISNRINHPAFVFVIDPIKNFIDSAVRTAENALLSLHWAVLVGAFALAGYALSSWRMALGCAISLLLFGLLGLWEQSMQTLALMLAAVLLSLAIGIPLGIACAFSERINKLLRPILDAMQTMPAFVYLIPVVLFFGVARVPAVIATIIYAIPPAIRLTNLGIREVQPSAVEAARAFGSTRVQTLFKVLLPLALPSIMAGVNQTIMMALGMVVIAAMVGAGGLGREVYLSLQRLQVGAAFEAGLVIVIMAIMLDRLSEALSKIDLTRVPNARQKTQYRSSVLRLPLVSYGVIIFGTVLCIIAFQDAFPAEWRLPLRDPVDEAIRWMRDNLYFLTKPISDFLTLQLLNPMRDSLREVLPWPVVVVAISGIGWRFGGWRLALGCAVGLFFIGLLGMWANSMDTLSQVLVTMLVTILIALPVGVLASQSNTARAVLRPILDFLQTVPTFVFLVPVIMLFNIGRVPGLIASVLYAIPVGIKLTELGIRQVAPETVEAARAFGSTRTQTIIKVQLPLARAAIALSINQMIMMVLAMVIISGMVGGAGLGFQAVEGLARSATGQGIEAGLAIVILAIILDRITQAWAAQQQSS